MHHITTARLVLAGVLLVGGANLVETGLRRPDMFTLALPTSIEEGAPLVVGGCMLVALIAGVMTLFSSAKAHSPRFGALGALLMIILAVAYLSTNASQTVYSPQSALVVANAALALTMVVVLYYTYNYRHSMRSNHTTNNTTIYSRLPSNASRETPYAPMSSGSSSRSNIYGTPQKPLSAGYSSTGDNFNSVDMDVE